MTAASAAGRGGTSVHPAPSGFDIRQALPLPAFWLLAVLLLAGLVRIGTLLWAAFVEHPVATSVAVGLFALYAVPFWICVRALDFFEREPPVLLAAAFAWGGLVATSAAIPGSGALQNLLAKLHSTEFTAAWGAAVAGPTVEEVVKTLGVVAIVLVARAQVNSVLDGVVYGALVGLGFQVVEDVIYAVNAVVIAGGDDEVTPVVATFFVRGFLAGLWSHTLFGALAGAGIGYAVVRRDRSRPARTAMAGLALAGAWACHFLWNSPLLADGPGAGGFGLLLVLLAKGVPSLALILLVVRVARHREADYYTAQLAALGDPRIATPGELRALGLGHLRADARRHAYQRAGRPARRAVRRLQHAQARLAVELSRAAAAVPGAAPPYPDRRSEAGSDLDRWHDEVLTRRDHLRGLGHPEAVAPGPTQGPGRRIGAAVGLAVLVLAVAWVALSILGAA
ncbi:PrsW family intramembrane metalloprotease [Polymorphospora rubra]|uniref:Integral membrane protein n=1 Tax=Polymorphospora rubra TaxID=338584 RepID=A0A810MW90_9ACTN|nr:PrsW family intramembrane metalloprotease [Polymorphospora rubra]BCJ65302.1 hypothetical protein Prubr_23230 [Polymorphospora rubra]